MKVTLYNPQPKFNNLTQNYNKPELDIYNGYKTDFANTSSANALTSYAKARVAFSGKTIDYKAEKELFNRIKNTPNSETISLDEAVSELKSLNLSQKAEIAYLQACSFETEVPKLVLNKKAVLLFKHSRLFGKIDSKYPDVIRTCLDNETMSFDYDRYEDMFTYGHSIKISARLKPIPDGYSNYKLFIAQKRRNKEITMAVKGSVEKPVKKTVLKQSDIFTPISQKQEELSSELEILKESDEISENLYALMKNSIAEKNFNLKKVYADYYSGLENCHSVDDVKDMYPEIEIPEKPVYKPRLSLFYIYNRFANENFDRLSLDILKKLYLDWKMPQNIIVGLEKSDPVSLSSVINVGIKYSQPSENLKNFVDKGTEIYEQYEMIKQLDRSKISALVKQNAIKSAKVWQDFKDMTSGSWLPVRLIRSKRVNPETSLYSTPNMVNRYLYNLYVTNPDEEYSSNPLEVFDNDDKISDAGLMIVNRTYGEQYRNRAAVPNEEEFKKFKLKFDKKALGSSFEHLEQMYTNLFYHKYLGAGRLQNFRNEIMKSYELVCEKLDVEVPQTAQTINPAELLDIADIED